MVEPELERLHAGTSLTARRTAALTTTSSAPIARAVSKSTSNCSYTASESVCVTPCNEPANMIVAPNSPRPRAKESAQPAPSPPAASGSATRAKLRAGLAPSVRAAATRSSSTASKAAIAARM